MKIIVLTKEKNSEDNITAEKQLYCRYLEFRGGNGLDTKVEANEEEGKRW